MSAEQKGLQMRCWARRLLPVTAFLLVLSLILAGQFAQPAPVRSPQRHSAAGVAPAVASLPAGNAAGISTSVGAIPGGTSAPVVPGHQPATTPAAGGTAGAGQASSGTSGTGQGSGGTAGRTTAGTHSRSHRPAGHRSAGARSSATLTATSRSAVGPTRTQSAGTRITDDESAGAQPASTQAGGSGQAGIWSASADRGAGWFGSAWPANASAVATQPVPTASPPVAPLRRLLQADVLVVAQGALPAGLAASIRKLGGVVAAVPVDAGRIQVNGVFVNVLGVSPLAFRPFAARPTARSAALWQNVAAGGMAISYTMGRQDNLQLTKPVRVTGAKTMMLPVAGFGTVGIGGVDAVVSDAVARSLGLPAGNAIVISAPHDHLAALMARIKKLLPAHASVAALVTQMVIGGTTIVSGAAGGIGLVASSGPGLTAAELTTFLTAAQSRVGMPYVWGGDGPRQFDCSGLVQWSLAQAGVVMPRVAADQARTGPLLPLGELRPGDLLFYHTDPTAPSYISHVAIYLGNGLMLQAPEPGMDVEIVAADFGAGFAGAVRIYPKIAAAVAHNPAG
jgi:cell wall-associated NlpC family hydrolase